MWWQDQIVVWQQLWPVRDVALLAFIMAADAITGLSAAARLEGDKHDLMLLAILVGCSAIFSHWGDFLPRRHALVDAYPLAGHERAFFESRDRQSTYWMAYSAVLLELQIVCAFLCAVLGRLRERSFYIWMALGYFGSVGAVLWLLVLGWKRGLAPLPPRLER